MLGDDGIVTAKVKAVTPDPQPLISFLEAYVGWAQYVVDQIWFVENIPSASTLHRMFYGTLRGKGFRAHHCNKIRDRAVEIVRGVREQYKSKLTVEIAREIKGFYGKEKLDYAEEKAIRRLAEEIAEYQLRLMIRNREFRVGKARSGRPVLKNLTARIDHQDFRFDPKNKILRIAVLNDQWVELKLQWYEELDKYLDGSWDLGEITVSYRDGEIWVYLTFKRSVVKRKPETIMGVDINFDSIAYTIIDMDGKLVAMETLLFRGLRRALHLKHMIEDLKRRHPRSWRYLKWLRRVMNRWYRKMRNKLDDACHYIAKKIVEITLEHNSIIVLEDLSWLKLMAEGSNDFRWELQLWTYSRIQRYIEYKAKMLGLEVVYVYPKGTSKTSPIGGKLKFINYRYAMLPNGHILTRDLIASWNLALRYKKIMDKLHMRGYSGRLSPDSPCDAGMRTRSERGKPVPSTDNRLMKREKEGPVGESHSL